MNKSQSTEDTLIEVWNLLDKMWHHHQNGSDLSPVPKEYISKDGVVDHKKLDEHRKKFGQDSLTFAIVFREIEPLVRKAISYSNRSKLRGYVKELDHEHNPH